MTTVRVKEVREVKLTPENELEILNIEYDRRYADADLELGDEVRFISNGKPKQMDWMGGDHIGRLGIVCAIGEHNSVKVLTINLDGDFVEVWSHEDFVDFVDGSE